MLNNQENCDYMQIVQYLASKSNDLRPDEIERLKRGHIWPQENSQHHSIISNLYLPLTQHRELYLPLIDLNRCFRDTPEGIFIICHNFIH